ncbi:MAG: transcription elongation factor GreB [Salinisphaeraceae bacterium]|nr:transcription elongation factor GreB [Salinisphaeraceae bacterium]
MSRYRPPAEKSSPYITAAGAQALRDELDHLWNERRPRVVQAMADAAAEGDRSENAEYIYRKKELREIDRRAGYLSRRVEQIKVVDRVPDDTGKVFFGATVTVVDEQGREGRYRIVGADEIDARQGWISIDSPVARALVGKSLGDIVAVRLPSGEAELEIADIGYRDEK